jgi:hypothetical protein
VFCSFDNQFLIQGLKFGQYLNYSRRSLYEVQKILGHTQIKTTQRYAHLSHDTLLDATNSVNTALGGMFMPMVSVSPAAKVQLVQ